MFRRIRLWWWSRRAKAITQRLVRKWMEEHGPEVEFPDVILYDPATGATISGTKAPNVGRGRGWSIDEDGNVGPAPKPQE